MDATLIVIDSDAELARARALVDQLMVSDKPADIARLAAQARLIAAYEQSKWPHRPPRTAEVIRYLMDQHRLSRADMIPILGTASRVSEVLRGKKGLSMSMIQRLRTASACRPTCSCQHPKPGRVDGPQEHKRPERQIICCKQVNWPGAAGPARSHSCR
jgi:HTH-type transcriptional regulator/antitoxin HigA